MSGAAKNISIVAIVLGILIISAGVTILVLTRGPGTVILEFTSVCDNDKDQKCNVTVVQNDVTKQSKDVCLFVWGVEQMGTTYKIHNDVNPLCTTPASSLSPGKDRIAQLDPAENIQRYTCQTIAVNREQWFPQILSYDPQTVTLASPTTPAILQQSGLSYSSLDAATSNPTAKDYASKNLTSTLSTSLVYTGGSDAKFRITGYDAKTKLWSLDADTCDRLGLDKGTGILIEPVCREAEPLARISVSGNGKKWYLTAGYFEALPSTTSSGYSSIVFWSDESCKPNSKYCQYWQIVDYSSVPVFHLTHETLTTNTGDSVDGGKWKPWLSSIQNGDGPSSISSVGIIDLTSDYLAPYAAVNPN